MRRLWSYPVRHMTSEEEEDKWWARAARAIYHGPLQEGHEKDWMADANCLVESVTDDQFVREPDEVTAKRWERICKQCPVQMQCLEWADKHEVSGVYAAGEWRE